MSIYPFNDLLGQACLVNYHTRSVSDFTVYLIMIA